MRIAQRLAAALLPLVFAAAASAQSYPARTITLILPFAAGGGSDLIARAFAKELSGRMGQQVVVENRPGATGMVGFDALSRSAPDGYTIGQVPNATIAAMHFQNRTLDADRMFTAIGNIQLGTTMIAVNPRVIPAKNLQELLAWFKAHPGATYTSSGQGSPSNLVMAGFALKHGLNLVHVNYKGNAPALADVVAGRVSFIFTDSGTLRPHLQSGALAAVATTSMVRAPSFPEVRLASEQGFPELAYDPISAILAPPALPEPLAAELRAKTRQVAESEAWAKTMADMGYKNQYMDAPTLRRFLIDEYERWGRLIRESGIKPE
jgi:tripartite-type tricarboxylate transporter receptor subunit TctC